MTEDGIVTSTYTKWNFPILVFFKDARYVLVLSFGTMKFAIHVLMVKYVYWSHRIALKLDSLGREILSIAVPAAMALAADPIASLIDTVFIGHIGPVEIAAVGISIALFNQVSKVAIFPLVSITTSFVAEEETIERINNKEIEVENIKNDFANKEGIEGASFDNVQLENSKKGSMEKDEQKESSVAKNAYGYNKSGSEMIPCNHTTIIDCTLDVPEIKKSKRNIPSASTALLCGLVLGVLVTLLLSFLAKPLLNLMGVKSGSPMLNPAQKYLKIRSLGAPAVLLSLAMQGVFRGFKDTKTPLYATVVGDLTNIVLDPILIFACKLGVGGAAIAHVLSQYLISLILLVKLMQQVNLLSPSTKALQFSRFLKNGSLLLFKVVAATIPVTLAASLAARLGATSMAAFQICLQVWLTSSLLSDGLAVAGQAIIASSFAEKNYEKATAAASRVLQMGFVLGLGVALLIGFGMQFGSGVFTKDINVHRIISIGVPFVAGTQPINSIAFVFDGVNFGAYDFAYSAYSMILVSILTIGSLFGLYKAAHFIGIWTALTIFMGLRAIVGIWRCFHERHKRSSNYKHWCPGKYTYIFHPLNFVAGTQPINSIAFVFDGVNFGAYDFAYSAYSMILVSILTIGSLFGLYKAAHFIGIWTALTIFMGLRAIVGIWRMGTGTGPWSFLRK
ncbi:MATE efflux family protein [Artemisia annua]|uniref:Protein DETOXIFICATION n=1 Tax=Artemisia annua TaxID=35608 RepID=A0A2U1KLL5_ARTAN|nr:MATE efflux family protein [Artemisia annua]